MEKIKHLFVVSIPEGILVFVVYIGYFLKIMHTPSANLILTLTLLPLGGIYMVGGWLIFSNLDPRILWKKINWSTFEILKAIFGVIAGLTMACWAVTIWARIMHLPIEKIYWYISQALSILATLFCIIASLKTPRIWLAYLRLIISFALIMLPSFVIQSLIPLL
jgi:hypothetical protein